MYTIVHGGNFYLWNILNVVLIFSFYYVRANRTVGKESDDETALKKSAHINIHPTYHHPVGVP
jgi:hypothetical protein